MATPAGLEPATPGLEGRCSIRLSYGASQLFYRQPRLVSLNVSMADVDHRRSYPNKPWVLFGVHLQA